MLDSLYEDIGVKIKNWAKVIFVVEAICSMLAGLLLVVNGDEFIIYGILTIVIGPIVSWVSSWILYGFGELIDTVCDIRATLRMNQKSENTTSAADRPAPVTRVVHSDGANSYKASRTTNPANCWTCTCGRTHQQYETSCVCGVSKREAMASKGK